MQTDYSTQLHDRMREAARRGRKAGWPECYYWQAVWWRLHAKESKTLDAITYSRNMLRLYRDIKNRPEHYRRKPKGVSDWIHSNLSARTDA